MPYPRVLAILVAATAIPVTPAAAAFFNPVVNGDFETWVPAAAGAAAFFGLDGPLGVGHQIFGCTDFADFVWGRTCNDEIVGRVDAAQAIVTDPDGELRDWLGRGPQEGDAAVATPFHASFFRAAGWDDYPAGSASFVDIDRDADREAVFGPSTYMLYQGLSSAGANTAIPFGLVEKLSFEIERGPASGTVAFALDSFPLEDAADVPAVSWNYQLVADPSAWTWDGEAWVVDPLRGDLIGPYSGTYLPALVPSDHPTAETWDAASREERRDILMELRVVQLTFWGFAPGTALDNVEVSVLSWPDRGSSPRPASPGSDGAGDGC